VSDLSTHFQCVCLCKCPLFPKTITTWLCLHSMFRNL
jgi:hypothetical protein